MATPAALPTGPPSATTPYTVQQQGIFALAAIFGVFAINAVAMRFTGRKIRKIPLTISDWLILIAIVVGVGHTIAVIISVVYGIGKHIKDIEVQNGLATIYELLKVYAYTSYPWLYATTATRASIIFMYTEIFPQRLFRLCCWVLLTCIGLYAVAMTVAFSLFCRPFSKQWDPTVSGSCGSVTAIGIASSVIPVILDLAIILLPQPLVWNLKMATRRKVFVSAIFSFGVITILITTLRAEHTVKDNSNTDGGDADFTWVQWEIQVYSTLEVNMGIICACLPTLGPFLSKVIGDRLRSNRSDPPVEHYNIDGFSNQNRGSKSKLSNRSDFERLKDDEIFYPIKATGYATAGTPSSEEMEAAFPASNEHAPDAVYVTRHMQISEAQN